MDVTRYGWNFLFTRKDGSAILLQSRSLLVHLSVLLLLAGSIYLVI